MWIRVKVYNSCPRAVEKHCIDKEEGRPLKIIVDLLICRSNWLNYVKSVEYRSTLLSAMIAVGPLRKALNTPGKV